MEFPNSIFIGIGVANNSAMPAANCTDHRAFALSGILDCLGSNNFSIERSVKNKNI